MTNSENSSGSILEWLGFRGARGGRSADGKAAFANGAGNVFQQARRHLLDEIAAFLLTYELDVTPNNLLTAHGAFSGGSVAKIVKLEHAWRRLDGRNDDGFQVAPFPG